MKLLVYLQAAGCRLTLKHQDGSSLCCKHRNPTIHYHTYYFTALWCTSAISQFIIPSSVAYLGSDHNGKRLAIEAARGDIVLFLGNLMSFQGQIKSGLGSSMSSMCLNSLHREASTKNQIPEPLVPFSGKEQGLNSKLPPNI